MVKMRRLVLTGFVEKATRRVSKERLFDGKLLCIRIEMLIRGPALNYRSDLHCAKLDLRQAAGSAAWLQTPAQGNECGLFLSSWCLEFYVVP